MSISRPCVSYWIILSDSFAYRIALQTSFLLHGLPLTWLPRSGLLKDRSQRGFFLSQDLAMGHVFSLVGGWACLDFVFLISERTRNDWSGLLKMQEVHSGMLLFIHYFKRWDFCELLGFVVTTQLTLCRGCWRSLIPQILTGAPAVWKSGAGGQEVGSTWTSTELQYMHTLWPFMLG